LLVLTKTLPLLAGFLALGFKERIYFHFLDFCIIPMQDCRSIQSLTLVEPFVHGYLVNFEGFIYNTGSDGEFDGIEN